MRRALVMAGCLLLGSAALSGVAAEDNYPARPVTFIVPWGPGGGADQLARVAGKLMEQELKVSFPVINVPGATGQTGLTKLVTGPADGYTIEVMTGDTFALFTAANARFKTDQLAPLGVMIQQPSGFFVKADSPWKTWADVEAAARKAPLRVAVTGFGSPDDFTVNYFRNKGLKLESVPFAEPGLRYSSVIGGQSDLVYEQAGDIRSFLDGKQIRPVLFFSDKPFDGLSRHSLLEEARLRCQAAAVPGHHCKSRHQSRSGQDSGRSRQESRHRSRVQRLPQTTARRAAKFRSRRSGHRLHE